MEGALSVSNLHEIN